MEYRRNIDHNGGQAMRIHTDTLTSLDVRSATPPDVYANMMGHGSRTRDHAFECALRGLGERHNRKANSGQYGAGFEYAATYSDWGFWFARLFDIDPNMTCYAYDGRDDFHEKTHELYDTDEPRLPSVVAFYDAQRARGLKHNATVELTAAEFDIPEYIIDRAVQGERAPVAA